MLNCLIRQQAAVEITTNEATRALNLLAKQSTRMHKAIYQNCLALDYWLLREELVENLTLATAACRLMMKGRSWKKSHTGCDFFQVSMSPCRLGKGGILMTCSEGGTLPWADSRPW
jgi:hypothetical protein